MSCAEIKNVKSLVDLVSRNGYNECSCKSAIASVKLFVFSEEL